MQKRVHKRILAMVSDLFFTVKISDAAKRAGMDVEFVKDDKELIEKAQTKPAVIILDLNFSAAQPLKVISKLKGNSELKQTSLLAFVSHVHGELKQKAHENGADLVMARSAFSQNLTQILKRHAGTL
jgi:CheY-like chemotaxis protein